MNTKRIIGAAVAVAATAGIACYVLGNKKKTPDVTFETAKVEKAVIGNSVTATGTIEPVTKVEVGTQVSGIISKIYVDYNDVVRKGQVIAELDKTNLVSELNSARSSLANAKSNLDYQQLNHQRMKTLHDKGLISANEYDTALLALQQARSTCNERMEAVAKAQTKAVISAKAPISAYFEISSCVSQKKSGLFFAAIFVESFT